MPAEVVAKFDYGSLDRLTRTMIESATEEIRQRVTTSALAIIEIGDRLIGVKQQLPHGKFCAWLSAEFDWSESTANRFMKVATSFKSVTVTDLRISASALYLLASEDTPAAVREEVVADAKSNGKRVTRTEVRERVAKHVAATPNGKNENKDYPPSKREPESPAAKPEDRTGNEITSRRLIKIFERRQDMNDLLTMCTQIKVAVLKAAEDGDELYSYVVPSTFKKEIENVYRHIKQSMPFAQCPMHDDDPLARQKCKHCQGRGWVREITFNQIPDSFKKGKNK